MSEPWMGIVPAKKAVVQPMEIEWPDGRVERVCCGPAALKALRAGAVGYRPVFGEGRYGRCCHTR